MIIDTISALSPVRQFTLAANRLRYNISSGLVAFSYLPLAMRRTAASEAATYLHLWETARLGTSHCFLAVWLMVVQATSKTDSIQ
jgi:hypothetical protein